MQFIRCFLAHFTTIQMSYCINDARRSRFCRDKQTVWRGEIGTVWGAPGGGGVPLCVLLSGRMDEKQRDGSLVHAQVRIQVEVGNALHMQKPLNAARPCDSHRVVSWELPTPPPPPPLLTSLKEYNRKSAPRLQITAA